MGGKGKERAEGAISFTLHPALGMIWVYSVVLTKSVLKIGGIKSHQYPPLECLTLGIQETPMHP